MSSDKQIHSMNQVESFSSPAELTFLRSLAKILNVNMRSNAPHDVELIVTNDVGSMDLHDLFKRAAEASVEVVSEESKEEVESSDLTLADIQLVHRPPNYEDDGIAIVSAFDEKEAATNDQRDSSRTVTE